MDDAYVDELLSRPWHSFSTPLLATSTYVIGGKPANAEIASRVSIPRSEGLVSIPLAARMLFSAAATGLACWHATEGAPMWEKVVLDWQGVDITRLEWPISLMKVFTQEFEGLSPVVKSVDVLNDNSVVSWLLSAPREFSLQAHFRLPSSHLQGFEEMSPPILIGGLARAIRAGCMRDANEIGLTMGWRSVPPIPGAEEVASRYLFRGMDLTDWILAFRSNVELFSVSVEPHATLNMVVFRGRFVPEFPIQIGF